MELLDIVDEMGNPTGRREERSVVHKQGLPHRTAHVWLVRIKGGRTEILLQKRSADKDSFPGCYDISSAGHIPAGVDYITSAVRELKEELGVTVSGDELIYCGQCYDRYEKEFYGELFKDEQVSNVYILQCDWEAEQFQIQAEELSEVVWMELEECMLAVAEDMIPHCIRLNELEMVRIAAERLKDSDGQKYCEQGEEGLSQSGYECEEVCYVCKGNCCRTLGCSLAPEDLIKALNRRTATRENVLDVLQNGMFAIDLYTFQGRPFYYLRMKHKCFTFIGVDAMGECIALTEEGCGLPFEKRPKGGRFLQAMPDRRCVQHYTKEQMQRDWRPYQKLLHSIWTEFYDRFQNDGVFDACEEAYMKFQREKREQQKNAPT